MANDGSVVIDVVLDSGKALAQYNRLGSTMSSATGKIGSILKAGTAAAIAGTAAVGVAAVGIGKQVLASYADYEQLVGGVDTLFGDASKTVQGYADSAYKTAGLSANQYMETVTGFSASMVSSLKGDTAKAADYSNQAVIDMADNANKMGSNIGDIQNAYQGFAKQNYTMLDNLKLGYGGTQEEMKRLLSDAEKFSGQKYDISSFADVTQAIHVVQTEMGITGTTAKEAAETISGSIDSTKAAYANLITGLGNKNADIQQLVNNLMDSINNVVKNITPIIGNLITALPPVITGLLSAIVKLLPTLFKSISSLFGTLLSTIVKLLPSVIPSFTGGLLKIIEAVMQNLPLIIDVGFRIITSLIQGLAQAMPTLMSQFTYAMFWVVSIITENLPMILTAAVQIIMALVQGLTQAMPELIPQIVQAVILIVTTISQNLPMLITAAVQIIVAIITGLAQAIPQLIPVIVDAVFVMVNAIIANLPLLIEAAIKIILAIIQGIVQAIPQLTAQMEKTIPLLVNTIINNLPMLINAAIQIIIALVSGLIQATPQILGSMNKIVNQLIDTISGKIGEFLSKGGEIIASFVRGILNGDNPVDTFNNFIRDIMNLFGLGTLYDAGAAIIQGFINGLKDKWQEGMEFIGGIGNWIKEHKGPISYDRTLLIPAGNAIMGGLDESMQNRFKKVQSNVSAMADKLQSSFTKGTPLLDSKLSSGSQGGGNNPQQFPQTVTNEYNTDVSINIEKAELANDADIEETSTKLAKDTERKMRGRLGG